ncbi:MULTISPECIES: hypothetical protein [unclassified Yoonia]|uniref:hypothetical protein n=1 Tax=unclassified Yoonia TaxID=2629118 RepID=UPI002AFFFC75|nr:MULTISPECIES: hypothetical protein [unclassified Yoonia]
MKLFSISGFLCATFIALQANAQDLAYPRFSPVPVYTAENGAETAQLIGQLPFAFGDTFEILEVEDETVIVRLSDATVVRLQKSDIFSPSNGRRIAPGPGFYVEQRAKLLFWDSLPRAEGFLRNGPMPETRPLLEEVGIGGMPSALPVSDLVEVDSSIGRSVQMAHGLIPISADILSFLPADRETIAKSATLHLIIDASGYARDFSQRRLQELSRRLDAITEESALSLTRTVLLDDGATMGPDTISVSGLRQILPETTETPAGGMALSDGLIRALEDLEAQLSADTNRDQPHIILILIGPSIREQVLSDPAFVTAMQGLRILSRETGNVGLMLGSVTPEPSEIPGRLLADMGQGIPHRLVSFSDPLDTAVKGLVDEVVAQGEVQEAVGELCAISGARSLPCLSSSNIETLQRLLVLPSVDDLEWFSMPLWYIVDGNTLVLDDNDTTIVAEENIASVGDETLASERRHLQAELRAMASEIATADQAYNQTIAEKDHKIGDLERERQSLIAGLAETEGELAQTQNFLAATRDNASRVEAELAAMQQAYQAEQGESARLAQGLAETTASRDRLRVEQGALEQALAQAEVQKSDIEDQLASALAEMTDLSRQIVEREDTATAMQTEIDAQAAKNARLELRLAEAETDILALEDQLRANETAHDTLTLRLSDLQADHAVQDTLITSLEREVSTLDMAKAASEQELRAATQALDALKDKNDEQETALALLNDALSESLAKEAEFEALLAVRDTESAEQEALLSDLRARNADLTAQISGHADELAEAQDLLDEIERSASLDRPQDEAQETIAAAQVQIANLALAHQSLEAELAIAQANIEEREAEHAAEISLVQQDRATLDGELKELQNDLGEKEREIASLRSAADALSAENEGLRRQIEVAMGVAEENLQLVSIIQTAEQSWNERETALLGEINRLSELFAATSDGSAQVPATAPVEILPADVAVLRPVNRPDNLGRTPSPPSAAQPPAAPAQAAQRRSTSPSPRPAAPRALPGSLFVTGSGQQPSETFTSGGGFFGN